MKNQLVLYAVLCCILLTVYVRRYGEKWTPAGRYGLEAQCRAASDTLGPRQLRPVVNEIDLIGNRDLILVFAAASVLLRNRESMICALKHVCRGSADVPQIGIVTSPLHQSEHNLMRYRFKNLPKGSALYEYQIRELEGSPLFNRYPVIVYRRKGKPSRIVFLEKPSGDSFLRNLRELHPVDDQQYAGAGGA